MSRLHAIVSRPRKDEAIMPPYWPWMAVSPSVAPLTVNW